MKHPISIISVLMRSRKRRSKEADLSQKSEDQENSSSGMEANELPTQTAQQEEAERRKQSRGRRTDDTNEGSPLRPSPSDESLSERAGRFPRLPPHRPPVPATSTMSTHRPAPAPDLLPGNNGLFPPLPCPPAPPPTLPSTGFSSSRREREHRTTPPPAHASPDTFADPTTNTTPNVGASPAMPAVVEPLSTSPHASPQRASPGPVSMPTMRKASNLPLPAYPTPPTPWQGVNGISTSPSGAAASGGKTSQVIEKLTAETERLRRELRAEKAARDEAVQETQAMKSRIRYLEEQNGTLAAQCSSNDGALARKERRLDDLRSRVELEVSRRQHAEQQAAVMARELEETVSRAQQDVSEAKTKQKFAEAAYTTIRQEYEALEGRIRVLRNDIGVFQKAIERQREAHAAQVTRLEVLLDQQRQRQEASDNTVREMTALVRSYQETEQNVKRLEAEMADTVLEMKWVMGMQRARGGVASSSSGNDTNNSNDGAESSG